MTQASDVRRLLSWLKMEDFKYREFARAGEASDAAAAWPALYSVAVAVGGDDTVVPMGETAAKHRIGDRAPLSSASANLGLVLAAARRIGKLTGPKDAAVAANEREGERLGAALRQRLTAARAGQALPRAAELPAAASGALEETSDSTRSRRQHQTAAAIPRLAPPRGAGGFFGGAYRRPTSPRRDQGAEAGGGDKSLRAIFAGLSRTTDDEDQNGIADRLPSRAR
jgi:hypothetical protein